MTDKGESAAVTEMDVEIEMTDEEKMKEIENYLLGYGLDRKLLKMDRYEREYYGNENSLDLESPGEVPLARARMYEVRHFVMSTCNCDEKLFLYYRYVKGETVERCAEMLGISRASGFRMRKRALLMAYRMLFEKKD
jgi:DNA-directed RNA polymerase specialized sigma subunit